MARNFLPTFDNSAEVRFSETAGTKMEDRKCPPYHVSHTNRDGEQWCIMSARVPTSDPEQCQAPPPVELPLNAQYMAHYLEDTKECSYHRRFRNEDRPWKKEPDWKDWSKWKQEAKDYINHVKTFQK